MQPFLSTGRSKILTIGGFLVLIFALAVFFIIDRQIIDAQKPDIEDPFLLGQYYFNANGSGVYDLAKARQYYMQAIEKDPRGNQNAWYQLGRIDFLEGNFLSALYKFDKQLEYFGEENPSVHYMIGLTYGYMAKRSGKPEHWQKGEESFSRFIELVPSAPWSRVDLAWIYFAQGRYEEMLPLLEEALPAEADNPWVQNMYGLALLNTGRREEARTHFEIAKEHAAELTVEDWGKTYPGNDPQIWGEGLEEFRSVIDVNLELAGS